VRIGCERLLHQSEAGISPLRTLEGPSDTALHHPTMRLVEAPFQTLTRRRLGPDTQWARHEFGPGPRQRHASAPAPPWWRPRRRAAPPSSPPLPAPPPPLRRRRAVPSRPPVLPPPPAAIPHYPPSPLGHLGLHPPRSACFCAIIRARAPPRRVGGRRGGWVDRVAWWRFAADAGAPPPPPFFWHHIHRVARLFAPFCGPGCRPGASAVRGAGGSIGLLGGGSRLMLVLPLPPRPSGTTSTA